MLLKPDPETAFIDPTATEIPTLVLSCNVYDPSTFEPYSRDAWYVALKAEAYLKSTGIADTAYFAPEAEFFIFDSVRYTSGTNEASYSIESEEAWWSSNRTDRPNYGGQSFPSAVISLFPLLILCRLCAPSLCWQWKLPALRWTFIIMKLPPPVRAK